MEKTEPHAVGAPRASARTHAPAREQPESYLIRLAECYLWIWGHWQLAANYNPRMSGKRRQVAVRARKALVEAREAMTTPIPDVPADHQLDARIAKRQRILSSANREIGEIAQSLIQEAQGRQPKNGKARSKKTLNAAQRERAVAQAEQILGDGLIGREDFSMASVSRGFYGAANVPGISRAGVDDPHAIALVVILVEQTLYSFADPIKRQKVTRVDGHGNPAAVSREPDVLAPTAAKARATIEWQLAFALFAERKSLHAIYPNFGFNCYKTAWNHRRAILERIAGSLTGDLEMQDAGIRLELRDGKRKLEDLK